MPTADFFGEQFTLEDEVNDFAFLEFSAASAEDDLDVKASMVAMFRLLKSCVVPADWARFRQVATANRAGLDSLTPIIQAVFEQQKGERPTGQPADSSDGLPNTAPSSAANSDDRVTELFPGRPDLQAAVRASRAV